MWFTMSSWTCYSIRSSIRLSPQRAANFYEVVSLENEFCQHLLYSSALIHRWLLGASESLVDQTEFCATGPSTHGLEDKLLTLVCNQIA